MDVNAGLLGIRTARAHPVKVKAAFGDKSLIVTKAAVTQFAKLMQQFGGSKERQRRQVLQETLTVFHPKASMQSPSKVTELQPSVSQCYTPGPPQTAIFAYSAGRVIRLQGDVKSSKGGVCFG